MAAFDTTRTAYGSVMAVSKFSTFIANLMATIAQWNDARVTRKALSTLTDRELDDIGLIRGDIEAVAMPSFFR